MTKTDTPITTILGGIDLPVTFADGTTATIRVRDLPMSQMPDYLKCVESESKTIALFTGQSEEWAHALTRESWESILEAGEARNLDFLLRFSQRAAARREKIMPGLQQQMLEVLARQLSITPSSSPESNA